MSQFSQTPTLHTTMYSYHTRMSNTKRSIFWWLETSAAFQFDLGNRSPVWTNFSDSQLCNTPLLSSSGDQIAWKFGSSFIIQILVHVFRIWFERWAKYFICWLIFSECVTQMFRKISILRWIPASLSYCLGKFTAEGSMNIAPYLKTFNHLFRWRISVH